MKYGAQHGRWIGDAAGYSAFHKRISRTLGTPKECAKCGVKDPAKVYHWANLTGHYGDLKDYARMCVSCHRKYDYARIKAVNPKALNKSHCKRGHKLEGENLLWCKKVRRCRICHLQGCKESKRRRRLATKAARRAA